MYDRYIGVSFIIGAIAALVEFYHLLGGGLKDAGWARENMSRNRLAILPDLTHYEIGAAPALGHAVLVTCFVPSTLGATNMSGEPSA